MTDPLKLYFVVGEVSGDALGADLLEQFAAMGVPTEPLGLGGQKMQTAGIEAAV